jgi:hypothetical protein
VVNEITIGKALKNDIVIKEKFVADCQAKLFIRRILDNKHQESE